ncbi:MAG TPA: TlpA disulfide reductase family protein [Polyangiaceae bacterium]|nr:TlpA disulfide reductase family protein [Polyangiaceae bacterium]
MNRAETASRKGTVSRISIAVAVVAIAVAAFVRPARKPAERAAAAPTLGHPTREGLVALGAAGLLERIQHTSAQGVLVNVWASWCGSCKADLPMLVRLRAAFGSRIELMLVSVDEESALPRAAEMLRTFGAPSPSFVVDEPLEAFKAAIDPRWPGMLPATFLFDASGKLRYFWGGPANEDDIVPLLKRYLSGEHIDGESNFTLAPGAVTR